MSAVKPIRNEKSDRKAKAKSKQRMRGGNLEGDRANTQREQKLYQNYKDAEWGFVNHWYPALFSEELADGDAEGITICGIPIVLRRAKGKVYALKDQCLHRGVKLSAKPLCLSDSTITCWYHGYTFDLESGDLVSIVAAPDDKIIGTTGITSYPVEEVNGMIFIFVRDDEFDEEVPPLASDLPIRYPENNERFPHPLWPDTPSVLDENAVCLGIHRTGNANWRIAVENGFDAGHLLIHKDNPITLAKDMSLPMGIKCTNTEEGMLPLEDEDGPKGFLQLFYSSDHFVPVLENDVLDMKVDGVAGRPYRTSVVLPGVLMVENWPEENVVQYEWYVPITDDTYEYWEVLVKICDTEEQRRAYEYRYDHLYQPLFLEGFNNCDLFARDNMQDFYADGTGWDDEQLADMDASVIYWRKQASRFARGIAQKPRGVAGALKATSQQMSASAEGRKPGYRVKKAPKIL